MDQMLGRKQTTEHGIAGVNIQSSQPPSHTDYASVTATLCIMFFCQILII